MSKAHAYLAISLALVCVDAVAWTFISSPPMPGLLLMAAIVLSTVLIARYPTPAALTTAALCLIWPVFLPSFGSVGFTSFLIVVAAADLISRRQWALAAGIAALALVIGVVTRTQGNILAGVVTVILQTAIALPFGLSMYFNQARIHGLEHALQLATQRTRMDVAMSLHDTVMTDLSKILVAARTIRAQDSSGAFGQECALIEGSAERSVKYLRGFADILQPGGEVPAQSLAEILREAQVILRQERRSLRVDLPEEPDLREALGAVAYDFLVLFIREGLVNCAKYTPHGATVRVWGEIADEQVEVAIVSAYTALSMNEVDAALTSGRGIENLRRRAQFLNGEVMVGQVADKWMLSIQLPTREPSHEETEALSSETREEARD